MTGTHVKAPSLKGPAQTTSNGAQGSPQREQPRPESHKPPGNLDDLIERVERVGVALFRWRALAAELAGGDGPKRARAYRDATIGAGWCPSKAVAHIVGDAVAHEPGTTDAETLGGTHLTELLEELRIADEYWPAHPDASANTQRIAKQADPDLDPALAAALERATQHVAVLMLWHKALRGRLGTRISVTGELSRWVMSSAGTTKVKAWIELAPPRFFDVSRSRQRHQQAGPPFEPIVLAPTREKTSEVIYGAATSGWSKAAAAAAILWAPIIAIMLLWAVTNLLAAGGISGVPRTALDLGWLHDSPPFAGLVTVFALVGGGAAIHLASKWLGSLDFGNGLSIQGREGALSDWLAVRWLSVVQLMIPITVAAGVVFVTKGALVSTQDALTAVLAGFSADALLRTGVARMQATSDLEGTRRQLEVEKLRAQRKVLLDDAKAATD